MRALLLVLVSLTLVGCGKKYETEFKVDPILMPYYQQFINEGRANYRQVETNDLIVEFGGMPDAQAIGVCYQGERKEWVPFQWRIVKTPRVVIDKNYFGRLTENERQALLFHELGHCILNLDHNERRSGVPSGSGYGNMVESLMYPSLEAPKYSKYNIYKNSYFAQLFGVISLAITDSPDDMVASNAYSVNSVALGSSLSPTAQVMRIDGCEHQQLETTEEVAVTIGEENEVEPQ